MLRIKIKLKEVMKENGITQTELAQLSGVAQARISKLCSTKRQEVNLEMLEKIAYALDIKDISLILQFEEEAGE